MGISISTTMELTEVTQPPSRWVHRSVQALYMTISIGAIPAAAVTPSVNLTPNATPGDRFSRRCTQEPNPNTDSHGRQLPPKRDNMLPLLITFHSQQFQCIQSQVHIAFSLFHTARYAKATDVQTPQLSSPPISAPSSQPPLR